MIYIIVILAILAVSFLVFKNKIKEFITKKVKEKKKQENNEDFVFIPIGMTRQFSINFTIEEIGGGKAKITVQKSSV